MRNDLNKQLAHILEETGELIKTNPEEHTVALRNSVKKIQQLTEKCEDPHLTYLSCFLSLYIDDVWSNIAVDSSYRDEIKDDDVRKILSQVGDEFAKLGEHLVKEDYHSCYDSYVRLVYRYLENVEHIKKRLEGAYEKGF